jgi:hypothetical protein
MATTYLPKHVGVEFGTHKNPILLLAFVGHFTTNGNCCSTQRIFSVKGLKTK